MGRSKLQELLAGRGLNRRNAMKALASVGVGVLAMPLVRRSARAEDQATVYTWSGYDDPKLDKPYVDQHGSPPSFSFFGDTTEAFNKLKSGYVVDVVHPCADDMIRWVEAGLVREMDQSRLTHLPDIWPELQTLVGTVSEDHKKRWFMPIDWGNSSIVYRTDLVDAKDPSWSILYNDDRYKGKVAMYDSGPPAVEIAAGILGYPDIFNLDDTQLKEVEKLLRRQREQVRFYWSDQSTIEQGIASGELVAAYCWNDAVRRLKQQGVPVAYMDPKEGMRTWVCGVVIFKDAPNEDLAYDFINSFTAPESGAQLLDAFGTGHSNRKAFDMVDPKLLESLGISNPSELIARSTFLQPVSTENEQKYNRLFDLVKAGG